MVGKFMMHENDIPYIRIGNKKFAKNASCWFIYDPRGVRITSANEARKFRFYDAHITVHDDIYADVRILRRSRRVRKFVPIYKGVNTKKECPVCRRFQPVLYRCNVCVYSMCRGCVLQTQKNDLSCIVCKVGMMPWGGEM